MRRAVLLALTLSLSGATATAQGDAAETDGTDKDRTDKDAAAEKDEGEAAAGPAAAEYPEDDLVARAIALRKRGDEAAALDLLREAYDTTPTPRVAGHRGLAERALGLAREAERHLLEALSAPHDPWVHENLDVLHNALRFAERQLAWVRVVVKPAGIASRVSVAGEVVTARERVRVRAGGVSIHASADGYVSRQLREEIAPERELVVTIELTRAAQPAPVGHGGLKSGERPQADSAVGSRQSWGYAVGAVGVLGVGLGTFFGLSALSHKNTADDLCPEVRCTEPDGVDADSDARRHALYSDLSLGVGVVALGVSLYLLFSEGTQSPKVTARNHKGAPRVPLLSRAGTWQF